MDYPCNRLVRPLSRREMLARSANGFGAAALAALLAAEEARGADAVAVRPQEAALSRQGQERHLPVHGRRPVAGRYLRPQAAARREHGQPIKIEGRSRRSSTTSATCWQVAVEVPASTARAASRSATCSRTSPTCVDDLAIIRSMVVELLRAHQRQLLPAHRPRPAGPAQHGRLGHATAWAASARTCPASSCSTAA